MAQNPSFYAIEHRNRSGTLLDRWENVVSDLSWEFNAIGGCGSAEFTITPSAYSSFTITADDDIKIWMDAAGSAGGKLVYRGYVDSWDREISEQGEKIRIQCWGYFNKLQRYIVNNSGSSKIYQNQSIDTIVSDVINSFAIPNSTPTISLGTVDASSFSPDALEFKGTVSEALDTLAQLDGNVEYGIDATLAFYWRTISQTVNSRFYLGHQISSYSIREETENIVNKVYFEGGVGTDGAVFTTTGQNANSQTTYGLHEIVLSNSSISTGSTANQIISATIQKYSRPKVKVAATIKNLSTRFEDNSPLGAVMIVDPNTDQLSYIWGNTADGGSNLTWGNAAEAGSDKVWGTVPFYQIDRVRYSPTTVDGYWDVEIDLGGSRFETPEIINQIEKNLEAGRIRDLSFQGD